MAGSAGVSHWLNGLIETQPWLLFFLLPLAGVLVWHQIRSVAFRLSKQRTERLYAMTKAGAGWRHAEPLALQIAISDAFRSTIDDRWIVCALRRHNPTRMLIDCKYANGIVRLADDGHSFKDARKLWQPNLRATSWGLYLVSVSPWIAASIITVSPWASPWILLTLAMVGVVYTPVFTWLGVCVEAARRLTEQVDQWYPMRIDESPVESSRVSSSSAKAVRPKSTSRSRKTTQSEEAVPRVN